MDIHIIGNGPSRELYSPSEGSIVIGCNYPDPSHNVEYSVFADSYALRLMRWKSKYYDRREEFKIVVGRKCWNGLKSVKNVPGGSGNMQQELQPYIHTITDWIHGDIPRHYVSSGHLAFIFAVEEFGSDTDIFLYGFDSLFTGNHFASHSNHTVRDRYDDSALNRNELEEDSPTTLAWAYYWNNIFDTLKFRSATFVGYEGDRGTNFGQSNVHDAFYPRRV